MNDTDPIDHIWWLASRSAGIVAWMLLSASVLIGLTMAMRLAPRRLSARLRVAHERIAVVCLGAVAAHGLLLVGDSWLKASVLDVLVPFRLDYRPLWTGLGICAAYLAAGLSLSYYARKRLGARRWRNAHRLIPVAWAMAAVHVLGAGTDIGSLWLQVPFYATLGAAGMLVALRLAGHGRSQSPRPRKAPASRGVALPPEPAAEASLWSQR
jgi:methionine sulfoxide reductase heme-binding subunit